MNPTNPIVVTAHFPIPLDKGLDYLVPDDLAGTVSVGQRVIAPMRTWKKKGFITAVIPSPFPLPQGERETFCFPRPLGERVGVRGLKKIIAVIDQFPMFGERELSLAGWISSRYACSLGEALNLIVPHSLPPLKDRERQAEDNDRKRQVEVEVKNGQNRLEPTPEQRQALNAILPAIQTRIHKTFLLYGVSASGKTLVYLEGIRQAVNMGLSAIYLVPEISLTPQIESLLKGAFGEITGVWHSELNKSLKHKLWQDFFYGKLKIVLGPRSALFAPVRNPGLIVVDEEHDPLYKSDSKPRYHARDTAIETGRLYKAPVVLGSATPSLESYQNALLSHYELLELGKRPNAVSPPTVKIIDMKGEPHNKLISKEMENAISQRLTKREQTILLINRRGFATFVRCAECGWVARCPACATALVNYKTNVGNGLKPFPTRIKQRQRRELRCNYCVYSISIPESCPQCRSKKLYKGGAGTERIEETLENIFPQAWLLRWDSDSMKKTGAHAAAHKAVKNEEIDIVVGTKMVAQGHDFSKVTLAGIIDADTLLSLPDFRASERTFQLISQVAGRAGRAELPGEVLIQTRHPSHYAVAAAARLDYKTFVQKELEFRKDLKYPPYIRLTQIIVRGKNEKTVQSCTEDLGMELGKLNPVRGNGDSPQKIGTVPISSNGVNSVELLGPAPAFHQKKSGTWRWQIITKSNDAGVSAVIATVKQFKHKSGINVLIDVDPEQLR